LGNPAITTAILDRLIHRAEIIHLNGEYHRTLRAEAMEAMPPLLLSKHQS